jgi:hypothetical protein
LVFGLWSLGFLPWIPFDLGNYAFDKPCSAQ